MAANVKIEPSARQHPVASPSLAAQAESAAYPTPGFANHSRPGPEGSPGSHGYSLKQVPQSEADIHPQLRSSHEPVAPIPSYPPVPDMIPPGATPPEQPPAMPAPPAAVAPAVGVAVAETAGAAADGRKAKRELSQSKRAAQNRAAQRAFRQRKEGYIKKLEQQVRDYGEMEDTFKAAQVENYALREYILQLQARLLDAHCDCPPPPPGLNLAHSNPQAQPLARGGPDAPQPPVPGQPPANPLEVAAQAVAGLSRSEHLAGRDPYAAARADDDARTAEEFTRQLQADGAQDGLPPAPM